MPSPGPLFRAAVQVPLSPGDRARERRLLLALIAAHADADDRPSVGDLADRLHVPGDRNRQARLVDKLLAALEADGVLEVHRRRGERNRYGLRLGQNGRA